MPQRSTLESATPGQKTYSVLLRINKLSILSVVETMPALFKITLATEGLDSASSPLYTQRKDCACVSIFSNPKHRGLAFIVPADCFKLTAIKSPSVRVVEW